MAVKRTGHYITGTTFTPKSVYVDVSEAIQIFKIEFIENIEYLIEYTLMTKQTFYREMSRYGVPSFKKKMDDIRENRRIGFDIYYVACVAKIFSLPVKVILNYNIKAKKIDLEKYGLYKDCFRTKARSKWDGVKHGSELIEPHPTSVSRKKEKLLQKAIYNSNYPEPTFNFWQGWQKGKFD